MFTRDESESPTASCHGDSDGSAEGDEELQHLLLQEQSTEICQKKSFADFMRELWEFIRLTVFVVGTALIVFIAARNTITWHVQRLWGASGSFWQSQWTKIHDWFEGDDRYMAMAGTLFVVNFTFFFWNSLLSILDVTGLPAPLLKYKIQEDKNKPVDKWRLAKCIGLVVFNQTVVAIPIMVVVFYAMSWRGCSFGTELPTFQWVVLEVAIFSLVEELFFYYSHRLLHTPMFYKRIHKRHHEWTAPIGWVAVYAHPIEHVIANMAPPLIGPLLMGSHITSMWLWLMIVLASTTVAHSGYHFPFLPSPEAHDYHHLKFNNNFGVLGVLDRLHGTDEKFRASKQYMRHFMLLSMAPVSQTIPDEPIKGHKSNKKAQ